MDGCQSPPVVFDRCKTPPIPTGTKPLQHQVAGHIFGRANGHRKIKIGFLQSEDGAVLKPCQIPGKGEREIKVYESIYDPDRSDTVLASLRPFCARYLGTWTTAEHPGQAYVKLEDVTRQFRHPCIMDIKVGPVTYDCEADEAKILRERAKFPALPQVGFQVVGIRFFDPKICTYRSIERTFLRALNEETILTKGLAAYLGVPDFFIPGLARAFLRRLQQIESWFVCQKSYYFIASSLLFLYDGDAFGLPNGLELAHPSVTCKSSACHLTNKSGDATLPVNGDCSKSDGVFKLNGSTCNNNASEKDDAWFDQHADIRMIDFTHVFPTTEPDDNYLTGLRSLITYLSRLV